jgi:hypothetical protein
MKAGNVSTKSIFAVLSSKLEREGRYISFTYQERYHAFAPSTSERDASGFFNLLSKRQRDKVHYLETETDMKGCLERAFFVLVGSRELYSIDAINDSNVVFIDTKV